MIKYQKLKKLEKSYLTKYEDNFFTKESIELKLNEHSLKNQWIGTKIHKQRFTKMWA